MLLLTPEHAAEFEALKETHKEKYGYVYLSPSSINDFKDCAHKFKLRSQFRTVSLTTVAGNIIHAFLKDVSDTIEKLMTGEGLSLAAAIDKIGATVNLEDSFNKCILQHTEMLVTKLQLKELLAKDKDKNILAGSKTVLDAFFKSVRGLIANKEFIRSVITIPPILSEIPGYFLFNNDHILYGVLDNIGSDGEYIYLTDYKSVWSSRSRKEWDNVKGTLQLWMYTQILKDAMRAGILPEKDIRVQVKIIYIELPQKYERINPNNLSVEVVTKEISVSDKDIEKYSMDMSSTVLLLEKGCGYIANSKYGCDSCVYNLECVYYTSVKEEKSEEES